MKKLIFFSVLLSLIGITSLSAQTERLDYKKMDYLKVERNNLREFLSISENVLKPEYQSLIQSDGIKAWYLYHVNFPGGEESVYNFVSIVTSPDLNVLETIFSILNNSNFVPYSATDARNLNELSEYVTVIKSELWKVENIVSENDTTFVPEKFMTMDYMNVTPGRDFDYLMLEDDLAKPIHVERISEEQMSGWEVYSLISPGGTRYGYNFATGNFYDELEHIEFGFTNEIINLTMGNNVNIPELFSTIYSTRELVKSELWELAVYTE